MESREIINEIKSMVSIMELEVDKQSLAAKKRCRVASLKIKNLAAEFKRVHK